MRSLVAKLAAAVSSCLGELPQQEPVVLGRGGILAHSPHTFRAALREPC